MGFFGHVLNGAVLLVPNVVTTLLAPLAALGVHVAAGARHLYMNLAQTLEQVGRSHEAIAVAQRGIEIGRTTGQTAEAEKIETWLKQNGSQ